MMNEDYVKCIICEDGKTIHTTNDGINGFKCPNCGQFYTKLLEISFDEGLTYVRFSKESENVIPSKTWRSKEFTQKAPAIAFERKLQERDGYTLSWDGKQVCADLLPFVDDYPTTFPDKMERAFMNLARILKYSPFDESDYFRRTSSGDNLFPPAALFTNSRDDAIRLLLFLADEVKWITAPRTDLKTENMIRFRLSWAGIKKALENNSKTSASAFLAMWFTEELNDYVLAVEKAVKDAGYKLIKIDQVHHNDYIMDKVLNLIRESRFIIADLTTVPELSDADKIRGGVRGGVYYEAGYAKGLGREVILTCTDTEASRMRVHFDTQQINTIFWHKSAESQKILCNGDKKLDFIDYLKERIIATVGRGPLAKQERR